MGVSGAQYALVLSAGPAASTPPVGPWRSTEREYSRCVLMLVGHGDGHDERGAEVGGVRAEVEVQEQSVGLWCTRVAEQKYRPDHVEGGKHHADGRISGAALTPV